MLPLMGINSGCYCYLSELCCLKLARPTSYQLTWPRCPTPLHVEVMERYLRTHPDPSFAAYITHGLCNGFHIDYSYGSFHLRSHSYNHPSSSANVATVQTHIHSHIHTELSADRLVGPLVSLAQRHVYTSPIGLLPMSHTGTRWRLIVDLSSPPSASVNDGIPKDLCSIKYASIDEAIRLIRQMGPQCQLVKMDLKDAYRMVLVHPEDQHLLAISWEGQTYVGQTLPFGLRSAPKFFLAIADAIAWVLFFQGGIHFFLHYLDDFLFFGAPGTDEATSARDRALSMFQDLGVPVAMHKTEGPTTSLTFLDIVIDTELLQF